MFVIQYDARRTSYRHSLQIYEKKIKVKFKFESSVRYFRNQINIVWFRRCCQRVGTRADHFIFLSRYFHSAHIHIDGPVAGPENRSTANSFILDFISLNKLHPMHTARAQHSTQFQFIRHLSPQMFEYSMPSKRIYFQIPFFFQANVCAFPKFICWIKQWQLGSGFAEIDFVVWSRTDSTISKLIFNWFHLRAPADSVYSKRSSTYVDLLWAREYAYAYVYLSVVCMA